jgi:rhodanese-related sulfurtransferase
VSLLRLHGVKDVADLVGGIAAWEKAVITSGVSTQQV